MMELYENVIFYFLVGINFSDRPKNSVEYFYIWKFEVIVIKKLFVQYAIVKFG